MKPRRSSARARKNAPRGGDNVRGPPLRCLCMREELTRRALPRSDPGEPGGKDRGHRHQGQPGQEEPGGRAGTGSRRGRGRAAGAAAPAPRARARTGRRTQPRRPSDRQPARSARAASRARRRTRLRPGAPHDLDIQRQRMRLPAEIYSGATRAARASSTANGGWPGRSPARRGARRAARPHPPAGRPRCRSPTSIVPGGDARPVPERAVTLPGPGGDPAVAQVPGHPGGQRQRRRRVPRDQHHGPAARGAPISAATRVTPSSSRPPAGSSSTSRSGSASSAWATRARCALPRDSACSGTWDAYARPSRACRSLARRADSSRSSPAVRRQTQQPAMQRDPGQIPARSGE